MSNTKINTIFIGTSSFGISALQKLAESNKFKIITVITQPDKKIGRKQILTPTPIKLKARQLHIQILQPKKISDIKQKINKLNPDLIVVTAYGQIIPKSILNIPKYGCINIHGSLLPKYRGASCIQAAILNGDKKSGITIIKMDEYLDTGPILGQVEITLNKTETTETLRNKLSILSGKILINILENYVNNKIKPVAQNQSLANYVGMLKKSDGKIDWKRSALEIERMIRAFNPWPGVYTEIKIKNKFLILKILKVKHKILNINQYKPGKLFLYNKQLVIQCGKDALTIEKLQLEGKRAMNSDEFLRRRQESNSFFKVPLGRTT